MSLVGFRVYSQCPDPQLYDLNFTAASSNPEWVNCIDNAGDPDQFTMTFISPVDVQNYVLDFGDGSTPESGILWPANTPITHVYDLGIYYISLSETANGCTETITGRLINDRKAGASALPPTVGTSGCVPHTLTFVNQSTNVSPFTIFEWDWGDGNVEIAGPETAGQPISHVYQRGSAGCDMVVSLTAYSLCDTTFSSYGPYDFWDIDTAVVSASNTRICVGQEITFTDQTIYNCNISQPRRIRWDFTELGGPVTGWLPALPGNRSQSFFVSGNVGDQFTVFMEDSNYCGVDPAAVTVEIIGPPQAGINLPNPTICAGQEGVFQNTSTGDADQYIWDFGDGSGVLSVGDMSEARHVFDNPGIYTVKLVAQLSGTDFCKDSTTIDIEVLPSSISDFVLDNISGCAPLNVSITEQSQNAVNWTWDFGPNGTFVGQNPSNQTYNDPGTYSIELTTSNSLGCGSKKTATVSVYPAVFSNPVGDSVCFGSPIQFLDQSTLDIPTTACATGDILYEKWDNIPGDAVSDLTANANYPASPDESLLLSSFEAPQRNGDDFGSRIHGFICPPQSGNYIFWIASDDNSELWLSSDANPLNASVIASINGFTSSREWNKFSSQQSAPVYLEAGSKYYISAIHKEDTGGDNLAVGWQLPSGTRERPIPGTRLSPYTEGNSIVSWTWDFGNGITSNEQNPLYTYPASGDYSVSLTVSTGKCSSTETYPVAVFPEVTTGIWQSDTAACTPLDLRLADSSNGATKFTWDFGDGSPFYSYNLGDEDTISHVYVNNSAIDDINYLSLIAENDFGCSDTAFTSVKVFPGPQVDFSYTPLVPQCSPVEISFVNTSEAADSYKWFFGNYDSLLTNTLENVNYQFVNNTGLVKNDTITLQAFSSTGCYGELSRVVTVFPEAEFDILADPDTSCHPAIVNFSVTGGAINHLWDFGDGSSSIFAAPQHVFNYTGVNDTSYTVSFIGSSAFNCKDTVEKDIVVFPATTANFIADVSAGCSPLDVNFQNLSNGGDRYIFTYGDGEVDTVSALSHAHTFINNTGVTQVYTITLRAETTFGCFDEKQLTITVYPQVEALFSHDVDSGCSSLSVPFENLSIGASSFSWNFGDGSSSILRSPTHDFTNNAFDDTTYMVTMTSISSNGCRDSDTSFVTVFGKPVADLFPDLNSGCSPLDVNFQNLSNGGDRYIFTYGDGEVDTVSALSHTHTFVNNTGVTQYYTVTLKAETAFGCFDEKQVAITVFPQVNAAFTHDIDSGCSSLSVPFDNISAGGNSHSWNFGDGSTSILKNPIHEFLNSGFNDTTYMVTLSTVSLNGCRDSDTSYVTVFGNPVAGLISDVNSGCSPLEVNFQNLSQGGDIYVLSYGNGDADTITQTTINYIYQNQSGTSLTFSPEIIASNRNGCEARKAISISVFPEIEADFEPPFVEGCSPLNVSFQNLTNGGASYNWNFGDGGFSAGVNPQHQFINSGQADTTYEVTLTATSSFGCQDSATGDVSVFAIPVADFITNVTSGCSPLNVEFTDLSQNVDSVYWDFGDGTSGSGILQHQFRNSDYIPRDFTITQTVFTDAGCNASVSKTVKVFPEVVALFVSSDSLGCSPLNVLFNNFSLGADYFTWDFGDGGQANSKNTSHVFQNTGSVDTTFTITMTATSSYNCQAQYNKDITIYPNPVAQVIVSPIEGCSPLQVNVDNVSTGASTNSWSFGDGQNGAGVVDTLLHVYKNTFSGQQIFNFDFIAVSDNGCKDTVRSEITVFPEVEAGIESSDTAGCAPFNVSFFNLSRNATSYLWTFEDFQQSTSASPKHTFNNLSNTQDTVYNVSLVASNSWSCRDTAFKEVRVFPKPKADFLIDNPVSCSPHEITINNLSVGATTYNWDFDDDQTSSSSESQFTHLLTNDQSQTKDYEIGLMVSNDLGCTDYTSRVSSVFPEVHAGFDNDPSGCTPFQVKLSNTTEGASSYSWSFGDGLTSSEINPTHVYTNVNQEDTTFKIQLIAYSSFGCSDTVEQDVKVFSRPVAMFSVSPSLLQLPDSTVQIINNSSPGNWIYSWNFGDGQISDQKDPLVHYYNFYGTYKIRLAVSGGNCADTAEQIVTVLPTSPVASFSGSGIGCSPVFVQFQNSSKYAERFEWDFGDGSVSNERNPRHTYDFPGTYTVTLKVIGDGGTDIEVMEDLVTVYPIPSAYFTVKPNDKSVKIPGNAHYFANLSENASIFNWDFGDGSTSSERSPFHEYREAGSYDVTLIAKNEYGCENEYKEYSAAIAEAGGRILVPNAFTPSGGGNLMSAGKNDYFNPISEGMIEFHMQIFNRWGELIFETFTMEPGWDGTYRGNLCKQDVYVFKIKAKFIDGEEIEKVGDVTLIR